MTRELVGCVLISWLALSCSNSTDTGRGGDTSDPPSFSVSPADQWSGGTVQVRATNLASTAPLPVIVSGTDTALVSRVNDSTFAVTIPQGPSASLHFTTRIDDSTYAIGDVQRYGLSATGDIGAILQGTLLSQTLGGHLTLIGVAPASYSPRSFDLQTSTAADYPLVLLPFDGALESDQPGTYAMVDSLLHGGLYSLGAAGVATLEHPFNPGHTFFSAESQGSVTRISDSVWVACDNFDHDLVTLVGSPPANHHAHEEECGTLVYHTGASWALASDVGPSLKFIDALSGDVGPDLGFGISVGTATADGSALLAVRRKSGAGVDSLVTVDPATRTTTYSAPLAAGNIAYRLATDPTGGRVYLLAARPDSSLEVDVFGLPALDREGILPLGEKCPEKVVCGGAALAFDAAHSQILIVAPSNMALASPPVSPKWTVDVRP